MPHVINLVNRPVLKNRGKRDALYLAFVLMTIATAAFADKFAPESSYQVCFTPGENCTQLIIDEIAKAKHQILVQMYTFTSAPIAKALLEAKRRGVDIKVLLDKSQIGSKYSAASFFINNNIPTRIDYVKGIAHNKLVLIDKLVSIGGSFNYTLSAQKNNVENVIIIRDPGLTKKYISRWHARLQSSIALDPGLQH